MKKSKYYFTAAVVSAIFGISGSVYAAPITLFNTGVDSTGVVLPNGSTEDSHYSLVSAPAAAASGIRAITLASGLPYTGDDVAPSRWIGPNSGSDLNGPAGNYTYETRFDLTGFDPSSASITGSWTTDNDGVDILLNGISLGLTTPIRSFDGPSLPFSFTSGFISGTNILDFVVHNEGGPTALRVELSGTADPEQGQGQGVSDVPVPAAFWLFGSVFASLMGMRRKVA